MSKDFKIRKTQQSDFKKYLFDKILPFVSKPGRYTGNEVNIIRKDLDDVDVRVALVFPDVYEVGMSYMGFPILYHILNKHKGVYVERAFAPWGDMEEQMRSKGIPLFTLETFTGINDFDVLGFTLQYEMHYTTILNLLDLSGIPIRTEERSGLPIVIAGGPCAFNPEPVADFFDAIVIGDAEEVAIEIVETLRQGKKENASRKDILERLAAISGIYVPSFYKPIYTTGGAFEKLERTHPAVPQRIRARIVEELKPEYYPAKPLVPVISTTHDRISLEIARGCSRGCRFCNAGMIYRPVRQRSVKDLLDQAIENIRHTGYDEVSLVSLSTSDYEDLSSLMSALHSSLRDRMVNLSFPSLRPEKFTFEVAQYAKGVRKSGLTLAPEAGSERLREVINKTTSSEDLLRAVDLAFREGWNHVKLYFMIGQPTETDEDLFAMIELIAQVVEIARIHKGKRINVSISPFVPKPITPFQWVRQDSLQESKRKLRLIVDNIRFRNVKLSWRRPELAIVEGVLARGDRRVGEAIERAWRKGAKFDGWSEHFSFERWQQALEESNLTFEQFLSGYPLDAPLPWDHIDKRVTKKFLRDEYEHALKKIVTQDCRDGTCNHCGLMAAKACQEIIRAESKQGEEQDRPDKQPEMPPVITLPRTLEPRRSVRVKYARGESVRFLSHLDVMRVIERAMRRADIPVAYSEGFNPRPKISYGPSLTTGYTSDAEYFDVKLVTDEIVDIRSRLNAELPEGMEVLETRTLFGKVKSITALVNRAGYEVKFENGWNRDDLAEQIRSILEKKEIFVKRTKDKKSQSVDIRPFIATLQPTEQGLYLEVVIENGKSVRVNEVLGLLFPDDEEKIKTVKVNRRGLWVQYGAILATPMDF